MYLLTHKQICTYVFTHTHIEQNIDEGTYTFSILFQDKSLKFSLLVTLNSNNHL